MKTVQQVAAALISGYTISLQKQTIDMLPDKEQ